MAKQSPDPFTAPSSLTPRNDVYPFIAEERHAGRLDNQTVLITGAGRGLGRSMALAFAAAGATVVCVARRQADIDAVVAEIEQKHNHHRPKPAALAIAADVSDPNAASKVLGKVKEQLGQEATINILIANAGMTRFTTFANEPSPALTDWWRVMEVNVRGTASFIRAVLPDMLAQKSGTIISLASTSGSTDIPFNTAYAVSKAALIKLNQDLGVELAGTGIHSFTLHPGTVQTDLASAEGSVNASEAEPAMGAMLATFSKMQYQTPALAAGTAVALCTESDARYMSGRYVDSQQDLEEVLAEAKTGKVEHEKLYWLKMEEL